MHVDLHWHRNSFWFGMTNYIPHYTKKKQILSRKEQALRRLVHSNAPDDKLVAAAEEVRDARVRVRVRVLRAQRATIVPKDDACKQYEKIDARIQTIAETSIAIILSEFGYTSNGNGT